MSTKRLKKLMKDLVEASHKAIDKLGHTDEPLALAAYSVGFQAHKLALLAIYPVGEAFCEGMETIGQGLIALTSESESVSASNAVSALRQLENSLSLLQHRRSADANLPLLDEALEPVAEVAEEPASNQGVPIFEQATALLKSIRALDVRPVYAQAWLKVGLRLGECARAAWRWQLVTVGDVELNAESLLELCDGLGQAIRMLSTQRMRLLPPLARLRMMCPDSTTQLVQCFGEAAGYSDHDPNADLLTQGRDLQKYIEWINAELMVKLTRPYRPSGLPPEEIYKRPPVNSNQIVEVVWEAMHLGLEIHRGSRRVRREGCGEPVSLKPAEFAMFVKLAEAAGEPCSKNELMRCWINLGRSQPDNISGQIARLRKFLVPLRIWISNKRASGYILEEGPTSHE